MKVRVLSDLHLDVNSNYCFNLPAKDDTFTVVGGDTAGDPEVAIKWLKKNVKRGIVIAGNHIVYNFRKKPIQELREEMAKAFPVYSDVSYLDVMTGVCSKVVDGVLFIGTTLYTDFKYTTLGTNRDWNMSKSYRTMNDFRYGIIKVSPSSLGEIDEFAKREYMTPKDYLEWFEKSFAEITRIVEENEKSEKSLPVFIVTHHCPDPGCVDAKYVDSDVNSSYISDLRKFIVEHPSIRAWCCGHCHCQKHFEIERPNDNPCLIVMNPRGYVPYGDDIDFNKNTFIDTETWQFSQKTPSKTQINKRNKRLEEQKKKYEAIMGCFF